jgi:predicted ATPase
MATMQRQKYIITGGPGSGKTSIIAALSRLGYTTFSEVSRTLIRQQMQLEHGVLPWRNMEEFAKLALREMRQQHHAATTMDELCFFDRGIPDIIGYIHFSNLEPSPEILRIAADHVYAPVVFICPPWPEIYVNDPERPQTFEDALGLFYSIKKAYETLHYIVIKVPCDAVSVRAQFILDAVHIHSSISI